MDSKTKTKTKREKHATLFFKRMKILHLLYKLSCKKKTISKKYLVDNLYDSALIFQDFT